MTSRWLLLIFLLASVSGTSGLVRGQGDLPPVFLEVPTGEDLSPFLQSKFSDSMESVLSSENQTAVEGLATLYHANGYSERAIAGYSWLLEQELGAKEKARYHYRIAAIKREEGKLAESKQNLEASVNFYSEYALSHFYLAEARYKLGEVPEASEDFQKALNLDATLHPARLGLARISLQQGDEGRSIAMLKELLRQDPDNFNGKALLAQLLSRQGESTRARELRASVVNAWAKPMDDPWMSQVEEAIYDVQRLGFRFEDYKRVGDYEEAFRYLDRIETVDPQNANTHLLRGRLFAEIGEEEQASRSYRKALALGGDQDLLYPLLISTLRKSGQRVVAFAVAKEAYSELPRSPKVLTALAEFLFETGKFAEAKSLLSNSLEVDPYDSETLMLYVRCSFKLGDQDEVASEVELLEQIAASNVSTLYMLSLVHMEAGLFEEALDPLEAGRRLSPDNAELIELSADAHYELGRVAAAAGSVQEALRELETALEINPRNEAARMLQVQLLASERRFDEAENSVEVFMAMKPPTPELLLAYGDLLYANGKRQDARQRWEEVANVEGLDAALRQAALLRLRRTE